MIGRNNVEKMGSNNGHIFEQEFKKSIPKGVYIKRLKVSGMNYKGNGNEGDYLVYLFPHLFIFELKSHKGKSIPFDNLRDNQLKGLKGLKIIPGVKTGFIFNFRDLEKTYFIEIDKVINFMRNGERKSFPIEWVESEGIRVGHKKARTRYTYDLHKLLQDIKEER